jgi:hypothetical protein
MRTRTSFASPLVERWIGPTCDAVVCEPFRFDEAREHAMRAGLPLVLCVPAPERKRQIADAAVAAVALCADAYASDEASLRAALAYVRSPRLSVGERCLTYLGSLGEAPPSCAPQIGASVPVGAGIVIGRLRSATVCIPQDTVGRAHAHVVLVDAHTARVTDFETTNGTFVDGERIDSLVISPGDEIAIAWSHRLRLD